MEILVRASIDGGVSTGIGDSNLLAHAPFYLLKRNIEKEFNCISKISQTEPALKSSNLKLMERPSQLNSPYGDGITIQLEGSQIEKIWREAAIKAADLHQFSEEHQFKNYSIDRQKIRKSIIDCKINHIFFRYFSLGEFFIELSISIKENNPMLCACIFESFEYAGYGENSNGKSINSEINRFIQIVNNHFMTPKIAEISRRNVKPRRVKADIEIFGFTGTVIFKSEPENLSNLELHGQSFEIFPTLDGVLFANWWCHFIVSKEERPSHTLYILEFADLSWVLSQSFERMFQKKISEIAQSYFEESPLKYLKNRFDESELRSLRLLSSSVVNSTKKEFFSNHQQVQNILNFIWKKADIDTRHENIKAASELFFQNQSDEIAESAKSSANRLNGILFVFTLISVVGVNTAVVGFLLDIDIVRVIKSNPIISRPQNLLVGVGIVTLAQCSIALALYLSRRR